MKTWVSTEQHIREPHLSDTTATAEPARPLAAAENRELVLRSLCDEKPPSDKPPGCEHREDREDEFEQGLREARLRMEEMPRDDDSFQHQAPPTPRYSHATRQYLPEPGLLHVVPRPAHSRRLPSRDTRVRRAGVSASKTPDEAFGAFRLTDPPGLKGVLGCRKSGCFTLMRSLGGGYIRGAIRPGHMVEAEGENARSLI